MIKKVPIATDGSARAGKAVGLGSDLAAKHGADIVLLHELLRKELSENLRQLAGVEYDAGECGQTLLA